MNSFKVASLISFDSATKNCQEEGRNPPEVCHSTKSPETGKEGLPLQDYLDPETKCLACFKNKWGRCNGNSVEQPCRSCTKYLTDCNAEGNKKKRGTTKRPRSTKKMFSMLQ